MDKSRQIGKTYRNYAAVQSAGCKAGLEKFVQNEHKRGFNDIDLHYCMKRLHMEVIEADEAYDNLSNQELCSKERVVEYLQELRYELADVHNFCDMGIYQIDQMINLLGKTN